MGTVNLRQARQRLSELVDAAERGESVDISRRGKKAARIVPVKQAASHRLPDLSEFRASIRVRGRALSKRLAEQRREERY